MIESNLAGRSIAWAAVLTGFAAARESCLLIARTRQIARSGLDLHAQVCWKAYGTSMDLRAHSEPVWFRGYFEHARSIDGWPTLVGTLSRRRHEDCSCPARAAGTSASRHDPPVAAWHHPSMTEPRDDCMPAYMLRREALLAAAGIGFLLAAPAAAIGASQYPDRPIKIIVPFAAGGAVDTMAA